MSLYEKDVLGHRNFPQNICAFLKIFLLDPFTKTHDTDSSVASPTSLQLIVTFTPSLTVRVENIINFVTFSMKLDLK